MHPCCHGSRRDLLKASFVGGIAAIGGLGFGSALRAAGAPGRGGPAAQAAKPPIPPAPPARVSLTTGESRADQAFRACRFFEKEIAQAIGDKRVVIKPNFVSIDNQLAATHAETIEGILEFLKSIGKIENVVIAESAASTATDGFANFRYPAVADKYGVKLVDLDEQPFAVSARASTRRTFARTPSACRRWLLDPNSFVISAAQVKTHDRVVATLSLKNIVFGAPIKDLGYGWGPRQRGTRTDKPMPCTASGFHGINYNLFAMAHAACTRTCAVIDGFEGMEGNGPDRRQDRRSSRLRRQHATGWRPTASASS